MFQQRPGRLVIADEPAAIDIAIAGAMLERNAPLPSGLAGGRYGIWSQLSRALAGNCNRAVTRQPVRPVLVTRLQRLLDEQTAKTRSIDEEVGLDPFAAVEGQRPDETVLTAQLNIHHLPFRPTNSAPFCIRA